MSGPDVEHGGWAIDARGSGLRRRRNPLLLVLAVVLLAGGVAAAVLGIVELAAGSGPQDEDVAARGVAAALGGPDTPVTSFRATDGERFTVWLRTGGGTTRNREVVVASVGCRVARPGRPDALFRGSRQGTAVTVEDDATIGVFTAGEGVNRMVCRHLRFGRRTRYERLRRERPFLVVRGEPETRGWWLLFGGIGAAVVGVPVAGVWRTGRLRRR